MSKNSQLADLLNSAQLSNIIDSGDLTFSGAAQRIKAPFGGVVSNRLAFQNSSSNAATLVASIPSGTATNANFMAINSSDISNGAYIALDANSSVNSIISGTLGSGSALPLGFNVGGAEQLRIDTAGNVTLTTTPAQFDNTTKVASTAFVQRALGNLAGYVTYAASTSLATADLGKYVNGTTTGITLTLPDATTISAGSTYYIQASTSATSITVASSNGNFTGPNGPAAASITISSGNMVQFVSNGTGWIATGGAGYASLTTNGYQKLPSGLIIQWGSWTSSGTAGNPIAVTFPIAFPNNRFSLSTVMYGASTTTQSAWADTPTLAGFNGRASTISVACNYIVIGN